VVNDFKVMLKATNYLGFGRMHFKIVAGDLGQQPEKSKATF